jgi:hypothetical protein
LAAGDSPVVASAVAALAEDSDERSDDMTRKHHELEMLDRLTPVLGDRLVAVLSYGVPVDHDDDSELGVFLLIVLRNLELDTLRALSGPIRWWLKMHEPWPRVFSTELLRESTDVFPIEYLELVQRRRVLFGRDPMQDIEIDRAHLRLQCEREMREKLMRLREGYVESHGHRDPGAALRNLLAVSYTSFVRIFRACLFLLAAPAAHRERDIVTTLCTWLDLSPEPLLAASQVLTRSGRSSDPEATFADYYHALVVIEARIDRMINNSRRSAP